MKRTALVILLLLGGAAVAQADNEIYNNILKQPRGAPPHVSYDILCLSSSQEID